MPDLHACEESAQDEHDDCLYYVLVCVCVFMRVCVRVCVLRKELLIRVCFALLNRCTI